MYCLISELEGGLESHSHKNMGRLIYAMSADLKPSNSRKPSYNVITSNLKMEAVQSCETLIIICQNILCYIPEVTTFRTSTHTQ
jgi:hypothetical protein